MTNLSRLRFERNALLAASASTMVAGLACVGLSVSVAFDWSPKQFAGLFLGGLFLAPMATVPCVAASKKAEQIWNLEHA